ncbi:MAG TPA: hypothetical protein VHC69_33520 [Polyangiaceae bacterium]|nr:hypothetical protein [Polyangiaceae bacterium]
MARLRRAFGSRCWQSEFTTVVAVVVALSAIPACGGSSSSAAGVGGKGAATGGASSRGGNGGTVTASSGGGSSEDAATGGSRNDATSGTSSGGTTADAATGGRASSNGGAAASATAGKGGTTGGGGATGSGGKTNPPPAKGTPGVWEDVTSPEMDPSLFTGSSGFGVGNIVTDPARPTDIYVGGYGSIWKSTDYGLTWKRVNSNPNPPYIPLGHVLAIAGTTPATLWMASVNGQKHVYRSRDAGLTFTLTGDVPEQPDAASLYSIVVDPYDSTHLITGLHEQDKVLESTDAGDTWKFVSGSGWPSGGISWFPFFLDTGDAATTRTTWFAIAQDGGSAVKTTDGGKTWTTPAGIVHLQHPHGTSGIFQNGKTIFVAGVGADTTGEGVYRSTDLGDHFSRVTQGSGAIVWGSTKNVYAMWGWACASCGLNDGGPQYQTAPYPGDTWTKPALPAGLVWGPNSVATTSDGTHAIYVGSMWATGLWRYVEP